MFVRSLSELMLTLPTFSWLKLDLKNDLQVNEIFYFQRRPLHKTSQKKSAPLLGKTTHRHLLAAKMAGKYTKPIHFKLHGALYIACFPIFLNFRGVAFSSTQKNRREKNTKIFPMCWHGFWPNYNISPTWISLK